MSSNTVPLSVVVLAAGQGTRMRSARPKVLHELSGRPLLAHVLEAARSLDPARIVVVHGHGAGEVRATFPDADLRWALQAEQLGTAHAVAQALPLLSADDRVLVLYGDVPLARPALLQALLEALEGSAIALVTATVADPAGYGRILRNGRGAVTGIVEHRDGDAAQRAIREVNTGILAARAADLARWIDRVGAGNAQGEYYLTDCIALAAGEGGAIVAVRAENEHEVLGVNDRVQLAEAERTLMARRADELMRAGVTVLDPARLDVRGVVEAESDVVLDINVILEGSVRLGRGCRIGAGCVIADSEIGEGVEVRPYCVIEGARIGAGSRIGPFARIRSGTETADSVHLGNFVEIKNAIIGAGAKINHLSYVGDADVGARTNIGAGTITCNYDGANKHRTRIGDDAFIGSNAALVAPVTVGANATIGAGSVITKDAPADELTLTRVEQRTLRGWKRPEKK